MNFEKWYHLITSKWILLINTQSKKFLTKGLDKRQNTKLIFIVYKNTLKFFLFLGIGFPNMLISLDFKEKPCKEIRTPSYFLFFTKKNFIKPTFFNDEYKTIYFANAQFDDLIDQIKTIQQKNLQFECVKMFFRIEADLLFFTWDSYFELLTNELKKYLQKNDPYNKDMILSDFLQNQNNLKKSYKNKINSLLFLFKSYENIEEYKKKLEIAKKWNLTYYILLHDTFLNLPDEFIKEWFKKF